MNELQEKMLEDTSANMSWCRPYLIKSAQHRVYVAVNEGEVAGLQLDGEDIANEDIAYACAMLKLPVGEYDSCLEALLDSPHCQEIGCAHCPWFNDCDAFTE